MAAKMISLRLDDSGAENLEWLRERARVNPTDAIHLALAEYRRAHENDPHEQTLAHLTEMRRLAELVENAGDKIDTAISSLEETLGLVRDDGSRVDEPTAKERFGSRAKKRRGGSQSP